MEIYSKEETETFENKDKDCGSYTNYYLKDMNFLTTERTSQYCLNPSCKHYIYFSHSTQSPTFIKPSFVIYTSIYTYKMSKFYTRKYSCLFLYGLTRLRHDCYIFISYLTYSSKLKI